MTTDVWIDYTNHRGERAWRHVRPQDIYFMSSKWHPKTQWVLDAYDLDKGELRQFAMTSIHEWRATAPTVEGEVIC